MNSVLESQSQTLGKIETEKLGEKQGENERLLGDFSKLSFESINRDQISEEITSKLREKATNSRQIPERKLNQCQNCDEIFVKTFDIEFSRKFECQKIENKRNQENNEASKSQKPKRTRRTKSRNSLEFTCEKCDEISAETFGKESSRKLVKISETLATVKNGSNNDRNGTQRSLQNSEVTEENSEKKI